eukprot:2110288-Pyramimonas_sp.AAC.1
MEVAGLVGLLQGLTVVGLELVKDGPPIALQATIKDQPYITVVQDACAASTSTVDCLDPPTLHLQ